MLTVDVGADFNGDQILCTWFGYDVEVIEGIKTWEGYVHVTDIDPTECGSSVQELELWNSQDDDGNEIYQVSKSKDYEKTFTIGVVPVTVAAGATGELGIKGSVVIDTTNTVTLSAGPYLSLTGYAEGGVGVTGFSAGIGVNLLILAIDLPFTATLQVLPSYPVAIFTFEAPLIISTLDGDLYIFGKIGWEEFTYTILEWEGFEWEIPLIDPIWLAWADETEKFSLTTQLDAPDDLVNEPTTEVLDYNWGSQSAFTADWSGSFNLESATYTFDVDADDDVTVWWDTDNDGQYDSADDFVLFGVDGSQAIDHAGGKHGTLVNGPQFSSSDVFGQLAGVPGALILDGSNYVELPTGTWFDGDFTIEAWVKPAEANAIGTLLHVESSSSDRVFLGLQNGYPYLMIGTTTYLTGDAALPMGQWKHVAVTLSGSTAKLYIDGVQKDSASSVPAPSAATRTSNVLGTGLKAHLDEVRVWSIARSETEIDTDRLRQLAGNEDSLEAYYRFDDSVANGGTVNVSVDEDAVAHLKVEYSHSGGSANLSLGWSELNTFNANYYDNTTFSGTPAVAGIEEMIDHDWGGDGPGADVASGEDGYIDPDSFSAQWEGTFDFYSTNGGSTQDMVFVVESDDTAVELYLDSSQLTLSEANEADTYYAVKTGVTEGPHDIELKYTHSGGDAKIKLDWLPAGAWFVVPYHKETGDWTVFDDPSVETDINEDPIEGLTGTEDMLWDYRGFFNFTTAGTYDFIIRADDGIKLIIDGEEYLGHWSIDEATAYIVPVTLSAGYHLIQVEHYDEQTVTNNYMVREVSWSLRQDNEFIGFYYSTLNDMDADDPWDAEVYDGTEPLLISKNSADGCTFTATSLDCDWGSSAPTANLTGIASSYLNTDSFGVRWIGDFKFDTSGVYLFTAAADDGIRVWVDDVIVMDEWHTAATQTYQEALYMSAGMHNIRIEYWENSGGAVVAVDWSALAQDTFNAQYFTSTNLTGTPTDGTTTASIDYSGGSDSARWVGVFEFEESDYTFSVNTDGGVRVYLDGKAIIDEWAAQSSSTAYTATTAVEAGIHSLKVEYFEGNSGTPAIDVSWTSSSEIAGNALEFDGDGDYVDLPDTLLNTSQGTIEHWVKTSATGTNQVLFYTGNANENGWKGTDILEIHTGIEASTFEPSFTYQDGDGAKISVYSNVSLSNDTWNHIAATWDTEAGMIYLYVNGELAASHDISSWTFSGYTSDRTYIGKPGNSSRWFSGSIDEVRIWDVARSQAEIQAYMKSTLTGTESNLVAYYQFDESSGTTAGDTTGSNDGTLNGDPQWVESAALLTEMAAPGSALSFDGSGDYVDLGTPDALKLSTFTLSTWFKRSGDGTTVTTGTGGVIAEPLVTKGRGESDGSNVDMNYFLGVTQAGLLVADFEDDNDGTNHPITGNTQVTDNVWHHAAVTYDGETLKLYLDGALDEEIFVDMTPRSDSIQYNAIASALDSSATPSGYFYGEMDEVRIWNIARTQAEIQADMYNTVGSFESGLVTYYRFDQDSGLDVIDVSSHDHDGVLNDDDGPAWVPSEVSTGYALRFDGSDDYITVDNAISLGTTYTVEGWFKTSNTATQDIVAFTDSSGNHYALIELDGSGIMRYLHRVPPGGSGGTDIYSSAGYADNSWHHFACVKDATGMYMYVDGNSVVSDSDSTAISDSVKLTIGRLSPTLSDRYFEGSLDEIRIWNTARTQTEIQDNMSTNLSGSESGLMAYYKFDEISLTITDDTGNGYDGTSSDTAIPVPGWVASGAMVR